MSQLSSPGSSSFSVISAFLPFADAVPRTSPDDEVDRCLRRSSSVDSVTDRSFAGTNDT